MSSARIHTFTSQPNEFSVNSFVIETAKSLVLIDAQFLVSPARRLVKLIEALGKPLAAVVVSHPHPDHFNGVPVVLEGRPDVPVISTAETLKVIRRTHSEKRAFWTPQYGEEYPKSTRFPDRIMASGESLSVDGTEIVMDDLGAGESSDITVLHLPDEGVLFASDLVYNGIHPWLAEGRSAQWLAQLALVSARYPKVKTVFSGHGIHGGAEILGEQAEYIRRFRDAVAGALAAGRLDEAAKAAITASVKLAHPGYGLDFLIGMNIDGVAGELKA